MGSINIYRRIPTERNKYIAVVAFVDGDHGTWCRVLNHKGINDHDFVSRPMLPEEEERNAKSWRLHWRAYETWQGLLEDELRVTGDQSWVDRIIKHFKLQNILNYALPN